MKLLSLSVPNASGGSTDILVPSGIPTGGLEAGGTAHKIIKWGVQVIFIVAILLALGNLLYAGWQIITSEGDKSSLESGRQRIIFSLLGLAIVLVAFFVVNLVAAFFGITLLQPSDSFNTFRPGGPM